MIEFPFFSTPISCGRVNVMIILFNLFPCISRRMAARRLEEERMNEEIPPQV